MCFGFGPAQAKNVILFIGDGCRSRIARRRASCPRAWSRAATVGSNQNESVGFAGLTSSVPRWSVLLDECNLQVGGPRPVGSYLGQTSFHFSASNRCLRLRAECSRRARFRRRMHGVNSPGQQVANGAPTAKQAKRGGPISDRVASPVQQDLVLATRPSKRQQSKWLSALHPWCDRSAGLGSLLRRRLGRWDLMSAVGPPTAPAPP